MFARNRYLLLAGALVVLAGLWSCSNKGPDDEVDDGNSPYMILDLQVVAVSDTSVTLTWTATGDDADEGTCDSYDMRYYHTWITPDIWDEAIQAAGEPHPRLAGSADSMEVTGLDEDSTYYFSLMAKDEAGNESGNSNCVMAMCLVDHEVRFPDNGLESAIRDAIHKPTGTILQSDLTALVFLDGNSRGIVDLAGIGQCEKLQVAFLSDNSISDLSPLSTLPDLHSLQVVGNDITDISPISAMDQLTVLFLDVNPLASVAPISEMTGLHILSMRQCGLTDLTALVANANITDPDTVMVPENPLSETAINEQIPALEARGVTVVR
ncbi:MAG: leucine-rich repeat domain-containing protein [Candidatus Zixiibacteriota bacterium]